MELFTFGRFHAGPERARAQALIDHPLDVTRPVPYGSARPFVANCRS